ESLQSLLQVRQRLEARLLEFRDPALIDLLQRNWVEEVQLFAAAPDGRDQICSFQHPQVLRDSLSCHVEVLAQLIERAAVMSVQQVEQLAPAGIRQSLEKRIGTLEVGHRLHATKCLPV